MPPTPSPSSSSSTVPSASTFSFKAPFPAVPSSSSSPASSSLVSSATLKHRRVSLALPSSPRVVQPWSFRDDTTLDSLSQQQQHRSSGSASPEKRGKMRRISAATPTDDDEHLIPPPVQEKKPRKKWSKEETQMLVSGCQRHGVGNWKTILSDPDLKFDDRSPVDLKDRFRTYFPDAYKQHYPNARTHLSSKVRSTLPDGTPLFEKTRSKKRRPFTEEEDRALKAGYEKHGTVWAAIVKDPVFQEQNRRSTDLRDRFRNAFPDLYQAAGYKPRNSARKKLNNHQQTQHQQTGTGVLAKVPLRAATDDQLALSSTGPVRSRRRAHTNQGLLRGGTKSVPQSTACSEDEDSSAGEEESGSVFKHPPTPVLVDNVSTGTAAKNDKNQKLSMLSPFESTFVDDDDEMEMVTIDPLTEPLFLPPPSHIWSSPSVEMSAGSQHAWSTSETSPASSHISTDFMMNSSTNSPPYQQNNGDENVSMETSPSNSSNSSSAAGNSSGMIGNSAWGTQDWFSPNPRLDPSGGAESSSSSSSFLDSNSGPFPSSPFSFLQNHHHLSQGVMDRYDLFPVSLTAASLGLSNGMVSSGAGGTGLGAGGGPGSGSLGGGSWLHDYSSEAGACDTHSTFSDEMFPPPSGFRGFTHHSNYAGDLIFGARTHQPPLQNWYNPLGFTSDSLSEGHGAPGNPEAPRASDTSVNTASPNPSSAARLDGLGLSGMSAAAHAAQTNGIHPMQLHTPSLPGIDEIELAGITLNDRPETPAPPSQTSTSKAQIQSHTSALPNSRHESHNQTGGNVGGLSNDGYDVEMANISRIRGREQQSLRRQIVHQEHDQHRKDDSHGRISLDEFVDLSDEDEDGGEIHSHQLQKWEVQKSRMRDTRLIRESSVDDVDLEDHATPPATPLIHSYPLDAPRGSSPHPSSPMFSGRGSGSGLHARSISVPPSEARSITYTDDSRTSVVHHYLVHDGVTSPMISRASRPGIPLHSRPQSHTQLHLQNNTRHTSLSSTPPSGCSSNGTNSANFSPHLLSSVISPPPSSGSLMMDRPSIIQAPMNNHTNNTVGNGSAADPYDLPFLDLHYYGISGSNHSTGNGLGWVSAAGMLFDEPHGEPGSPPVTHTSSYSSITSTSAKQALDLAQSPSTEMRPPGSTDPPRQYAVNSKADRLTGKTALSGTMTATTARNHQRGQSVASVCPQDLVLRRDRVDNKRKRASWDGFDGVYG